MATSGTYTFNLDRDDLIKEALELTTSIDINEPIPPEILDSAVRSLDVLLKSLNEEGIDVNVLVKTTGNISAATLTLATGIKRVERAFLTTGSLDYPVDVISRAEFADLTDKTATGRPRKVWHNRQDGKLYFYPAPDATYSFTYFAEYLYQDAGTSENNVNLPSSALSMLSFGLAHVMGLKLSTVPATKLQYLEMLYEKAKRKYLVNNQEGIRTPQSSMMVV